MECISESGKVDKRKLRICFGICLVGGCITDHDVQHFKREK
nr:MAG TPA: hypothetical protein [Caudoviricetes sp.]